MIDISSVRLGVLVSSVPCSIYLKNKVSRPVPIIDSEFSVNVFRYLYITHVVRTTTTILQNTFEEVRKEKLLENEILAGIATDRGRGMGKTKKIEEEG